MLKKAVFPVIFPIIFQFLFYLVQKEKEGLSPDCMQITRNCFSAGNIFLFQSVTEQDLPGKNPPIAKKTAFFIEGSLCFYLDFRALQIAVAYGSGEGQHIPDVAHTGEVHDTALKAQAEAWASSAASCTSPAWATSGMCCPSPEP